MEFEKIMEQMKYNPIKETNHLNFIQCVMQTEMMYLEGKISSELAMQGIHLAAVQYSKNLYRLNQSCKENK